MWNVELKFKNSHAEDTTSLTLKSYLKLTIKYITSCDVCDSTFSNGWKLKHHKNRIDK